MYPDETYTSAVYPAAHVSTTDYLDSCCASILAHPASNARVMPLPTGTSPILQGYYTAHFTALLSMWLDAELKRMKEATIPLVPLIFTPAINNTYRISIPGIREDAPKLAIGDRLLLRGMLPSHRAASNVALEAEVIGLNKLAGWVYVKSPHLPWIIANQPPDADGQARFRVQFLLSVDPYCAMQDAVSQDLTPCHDCADKLGPTNWVCSRSRSCSRAPLAVSDSRGCARSQPCKFLHQ